MNLEDGPFRIEPCDILNKQQKEKFIKAKNAIHIVESITLVEAAITLKTCKLFQALDKLNNRGAQRGRDFVIEKCESNTLYVLHTTTNFISPYEDFL